MGSLLVTRINRAKVNILANIGLYRRSWESGHNVTIAGGLSEVIKEEASAYSPEGDRSNG